MEIEDSSLYREVAAIIASPAKPVHNTWTADIHVGGETFAAMKVLSIDFAHDYENNFGEEIVLTCMVAGGTYAKRIYPNRANIDITLYAHPLGEVSDFENEELQPKSERYTATLLDSGNPLLENNTAGNLDEEALNISNMFQISFQLVNKALERLRMITVGGVFRYATVDQVIQDVLTRESRRLRVEGVRMPQGVDIEEVSNKEKREHIAIPQGTRLVDVPAYVHNKCGGVYSAGMGYYMQGDHWYVYPCYDTTRFHKVQRTLTVINVPPNKLQGVERSYRQDGRNTVVLATGEVRFRDDTNTQQLNEGNGVRFADARKFMEGFGDTKNNKTVLSRGTNVSEFIATVRANGNNQVQLSKNQITANPYVEYSRLARRQGSVLSFVWTNSNPQVIYPGMMVRVLYLFEDEIKEVYGVVLKAHHYVSLRGAGMTATRYQCVSSISLFVKPPAAD